MRASQWFKLAAVLAVAAPAIRAADVTSMTWRVEAEGKPLPEAWAYCMSESDLYGGRISCGFTDANGEVKLAVARGCRRPQAVVVAVGFKTQAYEGPPRDRAVTMLRLPAGSRVAWDCQSEGCHGQSPSFFGGPDMELRCISGVAQYKEEVLKSMPGLRVGPAPGRWEGQLPVRPGKSFFLGLGEFTLKCETVAQFRGDNLTVWEYRPHEPPAVGLRKPLPAWPYAAPVP